MLKQAECGGDDGVGSLKARSQVRRKEGEDGMGGVKPFHPELEKQKEKSVVICHERTVKF